MADADMQGTWQRTTTRVADTGDTWRHEAWQTVAGNRTVLIVTYYNETTGLIVSKFWTGVTGTMEVELEGFERVPEALPSSLVGRWLFDDPFGYRYVLTMGADRSFDLTVFGARRSLQTHDGIRGGRRSGPLRCASKQHTGSEMG